MAWDCIWPPPTPTRRERIIHCLELYADDSRKWGRRTRNFVRRTSTCIIACVDYLLLAVKWRLTAPRTERPRNGFGFIQNPICVFSFLERHVLESCQLVCKLWQRIIEGNHEQLALRTLECVSLSAIERTRKKQRHHPSFRRYKYITVESNLREVIYFETESDNSAVTHELDDRVMRLCHWIVLRRLRNAYVKELKFAKGIFLFSPLTAIKAAIGRRSSLSVGTLFLEEPTLRTQDISRFLRECQAIFQWHSLRFRDRRPRNYARLGVVSCSNMMFECPIGSVKSLTELLKRAKCSSLTIEHTEIKVNVVDMIETIRSFPPSQIPQELCLEATGNYIFDSGNFDPTFDLLNLKASSVSMTPILVRVENDPMGVQYRYRFPADVEGFVLEATIGLQIEHDVLVQKLQYRFLCDVSSVRPRDNLGQHAQLRTPTDIFVDILKNLSRKEVDSCHLAFRTLNGRIMTLSSVLPLHPLDYFKMDTTKSLTSEMAVYSIAFSYHFAGSCVRDVRIFDKLEQSNEPRSTAKIHLAFAHLRNTYIRAAFLNGPIAGFFCRYFVDGFYANIGTVDLNWRDQCEVALRFNSVDLASVNTEALGYIVRLLSHAKIRRVENCFVGNSTFVIALIKRFKQLEDTSTLPRSFSFQTETFGVSEVFKPPADDVKVTVEPAFAPDEPTSSTATCTCHRRRIRNIRTGDQLEICLIIPSNRCGVKTVHFKLVSKTLIM